MSKAAIAVWQKQRLEEKGEMAATLHRYTAKIARLQEKVVGPVFWYCAAGGAVVLTLQLTLLAGARRELEGGAC